MNPMCQPERIRHSLHLRQLARLPSHRQPIGLRHIHQRTQQRGQALFLEVIANQQQARAQHWQSKARSRRTLGYRITTAQCLVNTRSNHLDATVQNRIGPQQGITQGNRGGDDAAVATHPVAQPLQCQVDQ